MPQYSSVRASTDDILQVMELGTCNVLVLSSTMSNLDERKHYKSLIRMSSPWRVYTSASLSERVLSMRGCAKPLPPCFHVTTSDLLRRTSKHSTVPQTGEFASRGVKWWDVAKDPPLLARVEFDICACSLPHRRGLGSRATTASCRGQLC